MDQDTTNVMLDKIMAYRPNGDWPSFAAFAQDVLATDPAPIEVFGTAHLILQAHLACGLRSAISTPQGGKESLLWLALRESLALRYRMALSSELEIAKGTI